MNSSASDVRHRRRRQWVVGLLIGIFVTFVSSASTAHAQLPQPLPEAAGGFTLSPLAVVPAPTALAFGPGDGDGADLYATSLSGDVFRISLAWTPAGPVAVGVASVASGLSSPLGIAFDPAGAMYVADSHEGDESCRDPENEGCRIDGRVTRMNGTSTTVVVDGLPNGRHNTNHLRFGPDGRLYLTNGNPNDNGCPEPPTPGDPTSGCVGGERDVFPYSGAILSVDPAVVSESPAILHWVANGERIPEADIARHRVNRDFASKVVVLASGLRNIFGVAFAPVPLPYAGRGYTAMNGADDPSSQDALFRLPRVRPNKPPKRGPNFGFPFCFNVGAAGATGAGIAVEPNPLFPDANCDVPPATALVGWHTCTTGLDFPTDGAAAFPEALRSSLFVGECTAFSVQDAIEQSLADPENARHNTSHKIVRVVLDDHGKATEVRDFLTGLALATDVLFGPDGAMYVADAEGIFRVAPILP